MHESVGKNSLLVIIDSLAYSGTSFYCVENLLCLALILSSFPTALAVVLIVLSNLLNRHMGLPLPLSLPLLIFYILVGLNGWVVIYSYTSRSRYCTDHDDFFSFIFKYL